MKVYQSGIDHNNVKRLFKGRERGGERCQIAHKTKSEGERERESKNKDIILYYLIVFVKEDKSKSKNITCCSEKKFLSLYLI